MQTLAVVINKPGDIALAPLTLDAAGDGDVMVDVAWSGVSAGTERLLYTGAMPAFPGMGYPLVPGYESVGRIAQAATGFKTGQMVFVPGARCFGPVRGLFGGAAERLVVPAGRVTAIDPDLGADAVLLALTATAHHALAARHARLPELIIGHGILGRLLARLTIALGGDAPTVWDTEAARRDAQPYPVLAPHEDARRDYGSIYDASGSSAILDTAVGRLARDGEIVLAGFYAAPLSFAFPPAFMREARIRVAAEWRQPDMDAVLALIRAGRLNLAGLVTHHRLAAEAADAYPAAFGDPRCLKMVLDWSARA